MESRTYTEVERQALNAAFEILETHSLSPLDLMSGVFLIEIFSSIKRAGHGFDLDVHHQVYYEIEEALSHKAESLNPTILRAVIE